MIRRLTAAAVDLLITSGNGHSVALLNSEADTEGARTLSLPGTGRTVATSYDQQGCNGASPSALTRPSPCQCPPADSPSCSASPRTQAGTA
jgi:hypothetical protein